MKKTMTAMMLFASLTVGAATLGAQDLAKYRGITLGMMEPVVMKQTEQKAAEVRTLHRKPALIEELTWWPPSLPGTTYQADSVREILFSFKDGELYKMTVTYERSAVEGMTEEDMVRSISVKYGKASKTDIKVKAAAATYAGSEENPIALWEDAKSSVELSRSGYTDGFRLILRSKAANAEAEQAITQAARLEAEAGPQKEADRQKKEVADLEAARQKNLKNFHP